MNDIDVNNLEKAYIDISADFRSATTIISHLEAENEHLRAIVSLLLDTIKSFGTNN